MYFLVVGVSAVFLATLCHAVGDLDCESTRCPMSCSCLQDSCWEVYQVCTSTNRCNVFDICMAGCPCGSDWCAKRCYHRFPWPEVFEVVQCVSAECVPANKQISVVSTYV
mmetsp:Transcript_37339/g.99293  ORF Transcript_37339/g.99293 Transcript_37339/m.99293 type:complete len:110 (-) Transcript_37339:71-400(-)